MMHLNQLELAIVICIYVAKDTLITEEHWRKAYNLDPENLDRISNLTWVLIRSGLILKKAWNYLRKALKNILIADSCLWMKGLALHKTGKHEEACWKF